jgi:hypothetical protein
MNKKLFSLFSIILTVLLFTSLSAQNWVKLPGSAQDIAAGADGSIFVAGTNGEEDPEVLENGKVYKWNSEDWSWEELNGQGVRLAVTKDGDPWVVNDEQEIYRRKGGNWEKMPGSGLDIGIGGDNVAYVIGTDNDEEGNGPVKRWYNELYEWSVTKGRSGVAVDVGPEGVAFVVDSKNDIYRQKGDSWQQLPGKAIDVAVGNDGSVYVCGAKDKDGTLGAIFKWDEENWQWEKTKGFGRKITVDANGVPYVVNKDNEIYMLKK